MLEGLKTEERTMILRIANAVGKTLNDFVGLFWRRTSVLGEQELTKMFEENKAGGLKEVATYFSQKNVKGEIVIVKCKD